jgi:hypothetical protein
MRSILQSGGGFVQSPWIPDDGAVVQPSQNAVELADVSFGDRVQVLGLRGVRHAANGVGAMLGLAPNGLDTLALHAPRCFSHRNPRDSVVMRAARSATWAATRCEHRDRLLRARDRHRPFDSGKRRRCKSLGLAFAQPALGQESRKVSAEVAEDGPRVAHVLLILAGHCHRENRATEPKLGLGQEVAPHGEVLLDDDHRGLASYVIKD